MEWNVSKTIKLNVKYDIAKYWWGFEKEEIRKRNCRKERITKWRG